jgi:hypothetical protein
MSSIGGAFPGNGTDLRSSRNAGRRLGRVLTGDSRRSAGPLHQLHEGFRIAQPLAWRFVSGIKTEGSQPDNVQRGDEDRALFAEHPVLALIRPYPMVTAVLLRRRR